MTQSFTFIIKDNNYESYKKLASFLFLINALFFLALAINTTSVSSRVILFTTTFILLAYAIYNWKYKKKNDKSYIIVYFLVATIWISDTSMWYFSLLIILMLFLHNRLEADFKITVGAKNIIITGFLNHEYSWSALNNIILKDGLLTIDFKNNKVMQVEPDWYESISATGLDISETGKGYPETEKEFNDFCRVYLLK